MSYDRVENDFLWLKDAGVVIPVCYLIPFKTYTIELDVFDAPYEGLILAEVEFPDESSANSFTAPDWFGEDVTFSKIYHNSTLSAGKTQEPI